MARGLRVTLLLVLALQFLATAQVAPPPPPEVDEPAAAAAAADEPAEAVEAAAEEEPAAEAEEEEAAAVEEAAAEVEAAPEVAAAPPPPPTAAPASVQFMITEQMKQSLRGLGYSDADIDALAPERAKVIIDKGLKRTSSMPSSWKRGAAKPAPLVTAWRSVKRGLGSPVGLGVSLGVTAVTVISTVVVATTTRPRSSGGFDMAPRTKVVKAVKAPRATKVVKAVPPPEAVAPVEVTAGNPDDTWLDQQLDKLGAWLLSLFRR